MDERNLYEIFIDERAKAGRKNGTLSDMLLVDDVSQIVLLTEQVMRTLKEFCMSDENIHVKANEYGFALVCVDETTQEERYSHAKCENSQLDLKTITKISAVEIARAFPSVEKILDDIRKKQNENKPELPSEILSILDEYKDWNKYIPSYSQERLLCGIIAKNLCYTAQNSEWLFNLCLQIGYQVRNTFIKNKVVKVGLTNNFKDSFGNAIYNRIVNLSDEETKELFDLWINSKN